ncbi:hypothetical protein GA0115238_142017 [Streptomyces sp. di50b]|nr:hypothetical protein GA0115238_142017 [Streptomyces sp. di50b]
MLAYAPEHRYLRHVGKANSLGNRLVRDRAAGPEVCFRALNERTRKCF